MANETESCQNGDGICVPEYLCENGIIKLFGEGLIDERVDLNECSAGYVCCREDSYSPPLQVNINLVDTDKEDYCEGLCVPFDQCPEVDSESGGGINLRYQYGRCPSSQICCKNPTQGCKDGVCMSIDQCLEADTDINLRLLDSNCPFNEVCCKSFNQQITSQGNACKGNCVPLFKCMKMASESSQINLRISDECPPSLICCESVPQSKCTGTCTASEFCADDFSPEAEINLRLMDDTCSANQICCSSLKPIQMPNECEGSCVSYQECDDGPFELDYSKQRCPKNQVCCKKKKLILDVPQGCNGKCVALRDCPELAQSSSIDLRLSSALCPVNQVCCRKPFAAETCGDGLCIPPEDCADTSTSLVNLRATSDNCPPNTQCCSHPKTNKHMFLSAPPVVDSYPQKMLCPGTCTSYDQCQTPTNAINLRFMDQSCPKSQICCMDLKTTVLSIPEVKTCDGICVSARQCPGGAYSDHSINLRLKSEGCSVGQICCSQSKALNIFCNGTCVPNDLCLDSGGFNLKSSDDQCPGNQICCEHVKSRSDVSKATCNGRCVRLEQCPQYNADDKALINLRLTGNGCPFNQVCCQSSLPSDACNGVCTSSEECDENFINLRSSNAYCSNNQVCCEKLKLSTSTKCKGKCVPHQQCRNNGSGSNVINLRKSNSGCPANQVCCETQTGSNSCNGVCVAHQQCADDLGEVNLRDTDSGTCPINKVCCTSPKILVNTTTCDGTCVPKEYCSDNVKDYNEINLRLHDNRCSQNEICCSKPELIVHLTGQPKPLNPISPQENSQSCTMNNDPRTSILGKVDVPWLVSIWSRQKLLGIERNQYECVGSLLQPGLILTSADCLTNFNADQIYARIGDFNLKPLNTLSKRREYGISKITIHPDYNAQSGDANIAVLRLSKNSTTKSNVCLSQYSEGISNSDCFLIGWNKRSIMKDDIANAIPEKHLLRLKAGQFNCPEGMFCTDRFESSLYCDSFQGSPLVCFESGGRSWKVFGISTGKSELCDKSAVPNVLTATGSYEMWIREQISPSFMQVPMPPMPNRLYLPALP
ncbi:balbiani ring protein 3-like [Sabethes cyaneus]|uniref:balbiani ring protein 3-like n=1 Tax=Sabethes cyaneus TaxID=53552 RepID=UPI00237DAE32|nr:balbiani ring protein 3-like [Sabethes cyaneus]